MFDLLEKCWETIINKTSTGNTSSSINKLNSGKLRGRNYLEELKRNLNKKSQDLNSRLKTKGTIVTPRPKQFFRVM